MEIVNGLPIGDAVDPSPAPLPSHVVLTGRYVRLEPVDPAIHVDALWAGVQGNDHLWTYLFAGPYSDRAGLDAYLAKIASASDPLFFAIVDQASGHAVGLASLMRIDPPNRVIEVGGILYTPALQRTPGATEAMYLMAKYIFELGYRRYEWKCNDLNAPSRSAALRLGFTFEGIFRQHMVAKGRNRDTAWFSMLDGEWPACKSAFERWLDPANFDATGKQKAGLASLRSNL
jgi:RimJ/RimL family protein N-acetyltransferase